MQYEVSAPLRPNCFIDITSVENKKNEAMQCFISQLHHQQYDKHIEALNRYRTYTLPKDINSAEGFERYTSEDLKIGKHFFFQSEFQFIDRDISLSRSRTANKAPSCDALSYLRIRGIAWIKKTTLKFWK